MIQPTSPIQELAQRIHTLEDAWRQEGHPSGAEGGPARVATSFGPISRGRLHEWFGTESPAAAGWAPPLAILLDLADRSRLGAEGSLIVWVGRCVWPYVAVLSREMFDASIMIDPPDDSARLWAIDLAVRSPASCAVVADGSRLSIQATRRLQLAAESGRAMALLARPPHELSWRSAATTRWAVRAEPPDEVSPPEVSVPGASVPGAVPGAVLPGVGVREYPRWGVQLLRSKEASGLTRLDASRRWSVEWKDGQGLVGVPAVVADRVSASSRRSA